MRAQLTPLAPSNLWGALDCARLTRPWDVPWGLPTLLLGFVGWGSSFLAIGLAAPALAAQMGVRLSELSPAQQSLFVLGMQAAETAVGLAVIARVTSPYAAAGGDEPEAGGDGGNSGGTGLGLFRPRFRFLRADFSRPFDPEDGWLVWGLAGYLAAFVAVFTAAESAELLKAHAPLLRHALEEAMGAGEGPGDSGAPTQLQASPAERGPSTMDGVAPLLASGGLASALLLLPVTSILAPLLEETLFRGFLMPTLTKWGPPGAALVLSAALFAAAHLTPDDAANDQ